MAESKAELIETDGAEIADEETESSEGMSIEDEFRSLYSDAVSEGKRLKSLAMKAEQSGDASAAIVLREVAGGVVTLMQEVIAACGGAFADVETYEDGSHLDSDDAEKLHGLLTACRKLASEMLTAANGTEGRQGLETLIQLIDDQMGFVLEVSEFEPAPVDAN